MFTKLGAAVRGYGGINNEVHVGSRIFIEMPGGHVLSGTLEPYGYPHSIQGRLLVIQTSHGSLTANLEPYPVELTASSRQIEECRCFIPISGNRILAAFLTPHSPRNIEPGTIRILFRTPGQGILYWGGLSVGEGEGPGWIPRRM